MTSHDMIEKASADDTRVFMNALLLHSATGVGFTQCFWECWISEHPGVNPERFNIDTHGTAESSNILRFVTLEKFTDFTRSVERWMADMSERLEAIEQPQKPPADPPREFLQEYPWDVSQLEEAMNSDEAWNEVVLAIWPIRGGGGKIRTAVEVAQAAVAKAVERGLTPRRELVVTPELVDYLKRNYLNNSHPSSIEATLEYLAAEWGKP